MAILIVVNNPDDWRLDTPGVDVISARAYLAEPRYSELRSAKVFNLCRSYRYQSDGYYVSLLAAARGHKPLPSITTIQDLKLQTMIRLVGDDLEDEIQRSLHDLQSRNFELSIYFGKNLAQRHDRLALALFNAFPAPLLRARFVRKDAEGQEQGRWELAGIGPIPASEIPTDHWLFMLSAASQYFVRRDRQPKHQLGPKVDLAILHNPDEDSPPSDARAIKRFLRAARDVGFTPELVTKDDFGRLAEFEALFIRETTGVNHHTYRFARRAAAEGAAVIDDPVSILRCTNKVYLAELLERHGVRGPRTMIVHQGNTDQVALWVGLPCVLKAPDGSFSHGVVKAKTGEELDEHLRAMLARSDLVIAQQWLPSEFDWRVGVLAGKPLFACKYHMARGHWQIVRTGEGGRRQFGKVTTVPLAEAPSLVVRTAVKAANLIGDGLYGVDLKQVGRRVYVIEVNDNPNIDAGYEDRELGQELYRRVMLVLYERALARRLGMPSDTTRPR